MKKRKENGMGERMRSTEKRRRGRERKKQRKAAFTEMVKIKLQVLCISVVG